MADNTRSQTAHTKRTATITLDKRTVDEVGHERGLAKRSTLLQSMLDKVMGRQV